MMTEPFIEVDSCKLSKHGHSVSGDVIQTKRFDNNRVLSILCDGLGSGVEANVLASFTASMGIEYASDDIDSIKAADMIMEALPICPIRKIGYSTFSIADILSDLSVRILEYGNPQYLYFKGTRQINYKFQELQRSRWDSRALNYTHFNAEAGDRIILMSDGVTQSGIGSKKWPMGFGESKTGEFVGNLLVKSPQISASELSQKIVERAVLNDDSDPGDDISCLVLYIRKPRKLRVLTGPPLDQKRDAEFAALLTDWNGKSAVCGGTTSNIIERELGRRTEMDFSTIDPNIPVTSKMDGVDLITEGCITLGYCIQMLEDKEHFIHKRNGAALLTELFLTNDIIEFFIGTRINQAHQDPDLPLELDIRRNTIKKICSLLEKNYLKKTVIRYF